MITEHHPHVSEVDQELIGSIAGCAGLTTDEVLRLMFCAGLTVTDIINHLEAISANRIH